MTKIHFELFLTSAYKFIHLNTHRIIYIKLKKLQILHYKKIRNENEKKVAVDVKCSRRNKKDDNCIENSETI